METFHVYIEVGFQVENSPGGVCVVWVKCTADNKEAVKKFFQYKLGEWSVLDDGNLPPDGLKSFGIMFPIDHNLPDVLAAGQNGGEIPEVNSLSLKDGEADLSKYILPEITIGIVMAEIVPDEFDEFKIYIEETMGCDMSSPIPLDHYPVKIIENEDDR